MAKKIFKFFYNIDTFQISDVDGNTLGDASFPQTFLKQQDLVLAIDFVRNLGLPVTDLFTLTDAFGFAADKDFSTATALLMQTSDSGFNVLNDRPDLDVENGKISVQLDADTTQLESFLGVSQIETIEAEIQLFAAAATNPKGVFQFKLKVRNLVDNAGAGPSPTPAGSFYTKVEIDSFLLGKEDLRTRPKSGVDATVAATSDIQTIPTLRGRIVKNFFIRTTELTGLAGLPTVKVQTDAPVELIGPTVMPAGAGVAGGIMRMKTLHDKFIAAGEKIQLVVTVAGTSTTHVITLYDDGVEVDE